MTRDWELTIPLRTWQRDASKAWNDANRHGIVKVVTGAGKTVLALALMREVRQRNPRARFVVVVPSTVLQDQWRVALVRDLCVAEGEIACFGGGFGRDGRPNTVNLVVVNTGRKVVPHMIGEGERDWMLVADECHRYGSPENSRVLDRGFEWTLGLSATPEREYDEGFAERLVPQVGPVVFTYDYATARRDGVISPFALWNYRVPLLRTEQTEYDELTNRIARSYRAYVTYCERFEIQPASIGGATRDPSGHLQRLQNLLLKRRSVSINARMRIPAAAKVASLFEMRPRLVFHERIAETDALNALFLRIGMRSTIYHSRISPVQRGLNLLLFRRGACDVLVTCRALDEGLDVPEAEVGLVAASSRSTRQRIQRLGRVLRKAPAKDFAVVCTLFATDSEEEDLRKEATHLQDVAQVKWFDVGPLKEN